MIRLRNLLHAIVFYAGSIFFVGLTPVVALVGARPLQRWVRGWALWHAWCARTLLGIHIRIEGEAPTTPVLIAGRHESMYETIAVMILLDAPVVVLKQELSRIPVWGWAARRYGCIPIDRAGSASALRAMVRQAQAAFAEGRPVVIFPEGTRLAHGVSAPLQAGFAGLYRALSTPVVPMAVDSGRVWPRRGLKRPGTITFRFGAPIPAGLPRREAEALVHQEINALNPPAV